MSPTRLQPTRLMSPTQLIEMNQKDCEDGTLNLRRTKLTMLLDMSDCTIKSKAVMDSRDERVRQCRAMSHYLGRKEIQKHTLFSSG